MHPRTEAPRPRPDIRRDVALAPLCTLGVGGPAAHFVEAKTPEDVGAALEWAREHDQRVYVLGGGSNVVIADEGVGGLVVRLQSRGIEEEPRGRAVLVTAAAGEPWDDFVRYTVEHDLAGLECLSGIPGSVGATPVQNVGAYGQEVSDTVHAVEALRREDGARVTLTPAELAFGYRDSALKRAPDRYVVLGVTFALTRGGRPAIRYDELARRLSGAAAPSLADVRAAVIELRRGKSMVLDRADPNHRSCGSFFVNPIVPPEVADRVAALAREPAMPRFPQPDGTIKLSAGWLIERAGFPRGLRSGAVGLSSRHALAIVCHDGATAGDVRAFARRIRDGVLHRFEVRLTPEPVFWGVVDALE